MELNFDDKQLHIPCPACGQQIDIRIGEAKREGRVTCPGCSQAITLDFTKFDAGVEEANEAARQLGRDLRALSKTIKFKL